MSEGLGFFSLCFIFFCLFNLHFSWTWWDNGRTVSQWSEQMDPDLRGRWLLLCSGLYFMSAYSTLSVWLSGAAFVFLFLSHIKFTHAHTRRQIFTSNMVSNHLFASTHLNPGVLPVRCDERSFIPCAPVSQNAKQTGCINRPFQRIIICITNCNQL